MKEFVSETGGRYTYTDDFINLQDLALSINAIFADCGDFIVSGCKVSGTTISEGVVWLDGKLRKFKGANSVTHWPQYIYVNNTTEEVPYSTGGSKKGREVYGVNIGTTVPTGRKSIAITQNGGLTMNDAWFGKYAVLKTPANSTQTIASNISAKKITADNLVMGVNAINTVVGYNGISNEVSGQPGFKAAVSLDPTTPKVDLKSGGETIATFKKDGISFNRTIGAPNAVIGGQVQIGDLTLTTNTIANTGTANNSGPISINLGKTTDTYHRDTIIGDGKGKEVLSVIGAEGEIRVNGPIVGEEEFVQISSPIKEQGKLLSDKYVVRSEYNNDMAKKANSNHSHELLADSGWIKITQSLEARQIGDIVCIQGWIYDNEKIINIPSTIKPPHNAISNCFIDPIAPNGYWNCIIGAGRSIIEVKKNGPTTQYTSVSITYMV